MRGRRLILGVDEVDPPGQVGPAVVESQVQVAHHHHAVVVDDGFRGGELDGHPHFVAVLDIAGHEHHHHEQRHADGARPTVAEQARGHEAHQAADVEHEEGDEQVEHDEDGRRAHLVGGACRRQGPSLKGTAKEHEHAHGAERHHDDDDPFQPFAEGKYGPYMP